VSTNENESYSCISWPGFACTIYLSCNYHKLFCDVVSLRGIQIVRRVRKIAKSGISVCNVCPSVRPRATTRLPLDGFRRNLIVKLSCFEKSVEKIQVLLKSDKNNWYLT
jgi:hypothetical protein